jgi:hypothetical protein
MNKHFATRRTAHLLGFAGLIPFVVLSLGCWLVQRDWLGLLVSAQMSYGVAILSFLGAVHWGAAMLSEELSIDRTKLALLWGVLPSLLAVGAAQLLIGIGFALITAAFVMVYLVDKRLYGWYPLPPWFLALRFQLTCVVVASLASTFIAVNLRT